MSTAATASQVAPAPSPLQEELAGVEQVIGAGLSPFIKSEGGQASVQKITGEVNLGIAALPLFASLFQTISNIFHHAHQTAVNSQPSGQ